MSAHPPESVQDFDVLRQARERRGWSPEAAAERLHIRASQVEALEQGNFQALPGAAFARGYLKNYARLLDLDPEPLLVLFDGRSGGAGVKPTDHVLPDSEDPLLDYSRPMLLLSLVVAAAIAAIAWWIWGGGSAAEPKTAESTSAESTSAAASGVGASAPVASSLSSATTSSAVRLAVPAPGAALASTASSASTAAVASAAVAGGQSVPGPSTGLHFVFTGRCWVQVQDARGKTLLARLAEAGQTLAVDQGQPPYRILIGKAENVEISYDGKPVALPANALGVARLEVGTAPIPSTPAVANVPNGVTASGRSPLRPGQGQRYPVPAPAGMDSPAAPGLSSPQSNASAGMGATPSRPLASTSSAAS
ncbi:MAG: helix-turn-helix domain-containing protein [Acidithiobacillus sp.]|uniref:helix-turn-helix domain-containing protein n=1 Tax=Acidithiobacillus sp. TaxID=1872118 RepID=UPI003D04FB43